MKNIITMGSLFDGIGGFVYAATFALVLLLSGAITLSVNAELREKFFRWVITTYEKYSSFSLVSDGDTDTEHYSNMDIERVSLGYIPAGFELKEEHATPRYIRLYYTNQSEMQIYVTATMPDGTTQSLNTEGVVAEDIFVNGNKAYYWVKNWASFIVWEQEGYLFSLITELDKETAMKIAENIQIEYINGE